MTTKNLFEKWWDSKPKKFKKKFIGGLILYFFSWMFMFISSWENGKFGCPGVAGNYPCNGVEFIINPINIIYSFIFAIIGFIPIYGIFLVGLLLFRIFREIITGNK